LQKFSGTTEQLAHSAYPALPEEEGWQGVHWHGRRPHHKNSAAAERKNPGERDCEESPRVAGHAPNSQAPKKTASTFWGSRSTPTGRRDQRRSTCWSCEELDHFRGSCPYRRGGQ
jgi:hypothetical protein